MNSIELHDVDVAQSRLFCNFINNATGLPLEASFDEYPNNKKKCVVSITNFSNSQLLQSLLTVMVNNFKIPRTNIRRYKYLTVRRREHDKVGAYWHENLECIFDITLFDKDQTKQAWQLAEQNYSDTEFIIRMKSSIKPISKEKQADINGKNIPIE